MLPIVNPIRYYLYSDAVLHPGLLVYVSYSNTALLLGEPAPTVASIPSHLLD